MFEVMTFLAGAVVVADLVIPMTVEFVTGFMQLMYTVISRNQCVFCDKAKALLNTNHIGYVEYNIQSPSSKWLLHLFKEANIKVNSIIVVKIFIILLLLSIKNQTAKANMPYLK